MGGGRFSFQLCRNNEAVPSPLRPSPIRVALWIAFARARGGGKIGGSKGAKWLRMTDWRDPSMLFGRGPPSLSVTKWDRASQSYAQWYPPVDLNDIENCMGHSDVL